MPRGKSNAKSSGKADVNANRKYFCATDAAWGGFVNIRVSDDERSDFDGWRVEEAQHMAGYLDQLIVDGMKYSVTYDAEHSAYVVTFTGAGCIGSPDRFCLTARAGDWWMATELAIYKHQVLLDGDWGRYKPATSSAQFG